MSEKRILVRCQACGDTYDTFWRAGVHCRSCKAPNLIPVVKIERETAAQKRRHLAPYHLVLGVLILLWVLIPSTFVYMKLRPKPAFPLEAERNMNWICETCNVMETAPDGPAPRLCRECGEETQVRSHWLECSQRKHFFEGYRNADFPLDPEAPFPEPGEWYIRVLPGEWQKVTGGDADPRKGICCPKCGSAELVTPQFWEEDDRED